MYLYIQLNNVQQCCVNTAAQSTTQYATKTKSKMGDNSDEVVHVLQQLCSENIPVGTDGRWQAENITDEQDAILAKAIALQEGQELVSIHHFVCFNTNANYSNFEYNVSLYRLKCLTATNSSCDV